MDVSEYIYPSEVKVEIEVEKRLNRIELITYQIDD